MAYAPGLERGRDRRYFSRAGNSGLRTTLPISFCTAGANAWAVSAHAFSRMGTQT